MRYMTLTKSLLLILVVLVILVCRLKAKTDGDDDDGDLNYSDTFRVESCGAPDDPVKLKDVVVMPDPMVSPGKVILSLTMQVKKTLFGPIQLDLETQREIGGRMITVPCVYEYFGSCKYEDICEMYKNVPPCPSALNKRFPCKCPIDKSTYNINAMELSLDEGSLAVGRYKTILQSSNWMLGRLMCYIITYEIVSADTNK